MKAIGRRCGGKQLSHPKTIVSRFLYQLHSVTRLPPSPLISIRVEKWIPFQKKGKRRKYLRSKSTVLPLANTCTSETHRRQSCHKAKNSLAFFTPSSLLWDSDSLCSPGRTQTQSRLQVCTPHPALYGSFQVNQINFIRKICFVDYRLSLIWCGGGGRGFCLD